MSGFFGTREVQRRHTGGVLPVDVLVVDDNEINGRVYERVVARLAGCACKCFSRPDDALAWSAENAPVLAVVDYAMPGLDGIAFVKRFRQISGLENVPIIMLTGMNSARVRDDALAAGASLFLPKPISPDRFVREARRLLRLEDSAQA